MSTHFALSRDAEFTPHLTGRRPTAPTPHYRRIGWWIVAGFVAGFAVVTMATRAHAAPTLAPPTVLPPVEFDHAPASVNMTVVTTQAELLARCAALVTGGLPAGTKRLFACAKRFGSSCTLYIAPDAQLRPYSRAQVLRHEYGHCNGWKSDHPGGRR